MTDEFETPKSPKRNWRVGNIQLAEWENSNGYPEFSIQKSFKKDEEWVNLKFGNLNYLELDKLSIVIQQMKNEFYVKEKEEVNN